MSQWDTTGATNMNKDFKEIAKKLGIAIPACLFSIGVVNAETIKDNDYIINENAKVSEINNIDLTNNAVVSFMTAGVTNSVDRMTPDHTDFHTNQGGNHSDHHANRNHSDSHINKAAQQRNNQCIPHSDTHTNRDGYNQHTNSGNSNHSDYHTNRDVKPNC